MAKSFKIELEDLAVYIPIFEKDCRSDLTEFAHQLGVSTDYASALIREARRSLAKLEKQAKSNCEGGESCRGL